MRRRKHVSGAGFDCSCCGQHHEEMPLAFHSPAPANWLLDPELDRDPDSELGSDQCVVRGEEFYIRGLIQIPVRDDPRVLEWGVWASLSRENFLRASEVWDTPGREAEPSMFGWLSTALPTYTPDTLNLKTMVHTRKLGVRPLVVLEPTDHPLAVEQRDGIAVAELEERVAQLLHPA
jgi:hypothetical protein